MNNQHIDFNDNNIINLDGFTFNRSPTLDNEVSNKKYTDDKTNKNTTLRFNQTLRNYLKVSVGDDVYNLNKYEQIQLTDVTEIRSPNTGHELLPKWRIKNLKKNNGAKAGNFLKSTILSSPTGLSGAESLPPRGSVFMYIGTSSNNHGHEKVFVGWERTDIIQFSKKAFFYNSFLNLTND